MRKQTINFTWKKGIVAFILLLLLVGCQAPEVVEDKPTIGGLFGLTGFVSFAGTSSKDGFMLAIEDSSFPINYVIEDFASDMATTATAAQKLVEVDEVEIIIGPEWEFGAVVSPMAESEKALFISPWLTIEPEWTEPTFFMSSMTREQIYSDAFAEYISGENIDSVVIVYTMDDFGQTIKESMTDAFKTNDVAVLNTMAVNAEADSYSTVVTKIKQQNPDAVYTVLQTDSSQALFAKQLKELGWQKPVFIHYARGESNVFVEAAGDAAEGIVFVAPKEFERMDAFRKKFEARYGRQPAISAATAYDMTTLVIKSFESGARTPQEVQAYLSNIEDYVGYSGIITFEDGFVSSGEAVIKKIVDGQRVIIG